MIREAIQTLLDERTQFQQWLTKLADVAPDFRPAVTDRVRLDYEERLSVAESTLGRLTAALEASLAGRLARLEELAKEHDLRSAKLEEAQLRHEVGEYSRSEWDWKGTEHRSVLKNLNKQLQGARAIVEELDGVLRRLSGRTGPALAKQTPPAFDKLETEDVEPAPVDSVAVGTGSVARRNPGDDVFLAEVEFLERLSMDDSTSFDTDG